MDQAEQDRRRAWFRARYAHGVPYHQLAAIEIRRWEPDGVVLYLPYRDDLSGYDQILHGGVVTSLIDSTGTGAVLAGHDFTRGSRLATVSLAVQFLSAARGDIEAVGRCTRRGAVTHFAQVEVTDSTGRAVASGQVTTTISGERPGLDGEPPGPPATVRG